MNSQVSGFSYRDRLHCRTAWKQQTEAWTTQIQDLNDRLHDAHADPCKPEQFIQHYHDIAIPCTRKIIPRLSRQSLSPPNQLLTKWQHFAAMRQTGGRQLKHVFLAWMHWARFHVLKKQHRKHVRDMKRMQAHELQQQARRFADHHDAHGLYGLIKQYNPKNRYRKIHLRLPTGQLATKAEECELYLQHMRHVWSGPPDCPTAYCTPPGVPFTEAELLRVIQTLPMNKAAARIFAPNIIWKTCAETVVPGLYQALTQWWTRFPPIIPITWKTSWLTFIDKPHKSPPLFG